MTVRQHVGAREIGLGQLLDGIETGRVVLPDFQRDFDWNTDEVTSLLATIMRGWPAGSLLLIEGGATFPFRTRAFELSAESADIDYVVLDGQQRLTALFNALRNVGPKVYALRYDDSLLGHSLPDADTIQEMIEVVPRDQWKAEYPLERQVADRLIPLSALRTAPDFFAWRDRVINLSLDGTTGSTSLAEDLSAVYRNVLAQFNHYSFPCVVLDRQMPLEAVARIFERLNRQVRKLTTFDLMVARTYDPEWNLRDMWEEARSDSVELDSFFDDHDGLAVIQLVALIHDGDVRQPKVLSLPPEVVREWWPKATDALIAAVQRVRSYGALHSEWLPYRAQLLTLGGLAFNHDLDAVPDLEHWFWGSSLGTTYDVGSSTRIVKDLRDLSHDQDPAESHPEAERPFVGVDALASATRRRSPALWRAFMCLTTVADPLDLFTGEALNGREHDEGTATVSVLSKRRGADTAGGLHLRTFGLVRASRSSSKLIRRSSFHRVLREAEADAELLNDRLRSQMLPDRDTTLDLIVDDPAGLLTMRVMLALEFLEDRLGTLPVQLERSIS